MPKRLKKHVHRAMNRRMKGAKKSVKPIKINTKPVA